MLTEQGPKPIQLDPKCTADSLILYIYYNQLQWLGVNFALTSEYGELSFNDFILKQTVVILWHHIMYKLI